MASAAEGAPRRRTRQAFGVEDLGQTNAAVVGRNCVAAQRRQRMDMSEMTR